MPTVNLSTALSGGGSTISKSVPRTSDGVASREVTLPVGAAGTLTTRTDNNTGTITASSGGHGISTGDIVDIHWSTGVQYKVTVGTVSGTSIPIDNGVGDNLPSSSTAVVVTKRVQINADIDGDNLTVIGAVVEYASSSSTARGHLHFVDSGAATIAEIDTVANIPQVWDITGGATNVFTGNPITAIYATNGSSSEAGTLKIIWGVDSTP